MTAPLLPQAFWFRIAAACPRIENLPRAGSKSLLDLPESCRLPRTSKLEGRQSWADVKVAWNPKGLAVSLEAQCDLVGLDLDEKPSGAYGAQIFIDTRDTRDVSRATRFCHRFDATLAKGAKKTTLDLKIQQKPIARALADPPMARRESISSSVERLKPGWRAEVFFPSAVLNGYDPDTNRRLGFAYRILHPDLPDETLGTGREFPLGENPSLWSTLELRDQLPS